MTSRDSTRRTHLRRVGAALAAVGVAGCSAGDDTETDPGDTATLTVEPTGTDTAAAASDTATAEPDSTATEAGAGPTTETDSPGTTAAPLHPGYDYETTEVVAETPEEERLGSVTAAVADTPEKRFTGLSDTDSLPDDRGMLFVYDEVGDHTFVMRRMSFGIDIVYADDGGVITTIHHAPEPGPDEDGNEQEYPGNGQYVLEVNYEWTTRHGVAEGDVLAFEL